jgi:hypothetical protein
MEKYYCQLVAKNLKKMMCTPQDDFRIDNTFLRGLDKESFINGYKEAFALFSQIHEDIYNNPQSFGCPLLDVSVFNVFDPKVISMKITPIFDFIYALMESSRLENNSCIIATDTFMVLKKFFNLTKLSLFYNLLTEYGFSFQGWDGSNKLENNSSFILEYMDNPNLLTVLKAASEKAHKINENKATKILDEHYYTMSYHLFSENNETVPPYTQENYKHFLNDDQYAFIQSLMNLWNLKE